MVFIDNWFNSHSLLCELKAIEIFAVGKLRDFFLSELLGQTESVTAHFVDSKTLLSQASGSMDLKIDVDNKIIACKWANNKAECLASTNVASDPVDEVLRWSTSQKESVPVLYSSHRQGVQYSYGWSGPPRYACGALQK